MCTDPVDEQDRPAVHDVLMRNEIQIPIHVEAGMWHLKPHVFVPRTVIKLNWKKSTDWLDINVFTPNSLQREKPNQP